MSVDAKGTVLATLVTSGAPVVAPCNLLARFVAGERGIGVRWSRPARAR